MEGFGWILLNGREGPPGPPGEAGPAGFADIFYAVGMKEKQVIGRTTTMIQWDIPEFQDTSYQLEESERKVLVISNTGSEPARYQIRIKLSMVLLEGELAEIELYLNQGKLTVPGSRTYESIRKGRRSINFGGIIEVDPGRKSKLKIEGRVIKGTGEVQILPDDSSYWEVIKTG